MFQTKVVWLKGEHKMVDLIFDNFLKVT